MKSRKRCIVRVNKIRSISRRMSDEPGAKNISCELRDEPGAENIPCELRDADGLEATEEKSVQWTRREW